MEESYHKWNTPFCGTEFEMLVFGERGIPVILFPTSMGRYYESKDRGLIETVEWFLDIGKFKIYCPDSLDAQSWYNTSISPAQRVLNHMQYDKLILEEIIPRAFRETGASRAIMAGCSFGGYHAVNFAFRHPALISYTFAMSGVFDIKPRLDGYYDQNVYFNNPVDFMGDASNTDLWKLGIALGCGDKDICRSQNETMSGILDRKGIQHWLDIRPDAVHDWPLWKDMFPHYLSLVD